MSIGLGLSCLGTHVGRALHLSAWVGPPSGTVLPAVSLEPQQCLPCGVMGRCHAPGGTPVLSGRQCVCGKWWGTSSDVPPAPLKARNKDVDQADPRGLLLPRAPSPKVTGVEVPGGGILVMTPMQQNQ